MLSNSLLINVQVKVSMDTGISSIVGRVFVSALFLCVMAWGLGAYFHGGFFTDPAAVDLASRFLVGTLVAGFFLFVLFAENEQTAIG